MLFASLNPLFVAWAESGVARTRAKDRAAARNLPDFLICCPLLHTQLFANRKEAYKKSKSAAQRQGDRRHHRIEGSKRQELDDSGEKFKPVHHILHRLSVDEKHNPQRDRRSDKPQDRSFYHKRGPDHKVRRSDKTHDPVLVLPEFSRNGDRIADQEYRNSQQHGDQDAEQQAQDLITYIKENARESDDGIWNTNIFGKSIEELVTDGMRNKIVAINDESQSKLQDTMQKIVNDSNGGMVCIII